MKFGLFGGARVGRADTLHDSYAYEDFVNYVLMAEKLGFSGMFLVEHHFTGQGQLSASLNLLSDRKSTRLNSSHVSESRMPSSA